MSIKLSSIQKYSILSLVILNTICGFALQETNQIPLKSNIRSGQLNNGLTYYIKPTHDASSKVDMRLIIKGGSQNENSDQYSFAHLLEHIAISEVNRSNLLDEGGISMYNTPASVHYDHTKYGMVLSGGQKDASRIGLPYFKNKLNIKLRPEKIEKESRTVLNEDNGGLQRTHTIIRDLELELMGLTASRPRDFADHLFSIKQDSLLQFYKKWYRPDLMALIIVGDISNIEELENDIRSIFNNNPPIGKVPNEKNIFQNYINRKPTFLKKENSTGVAEGTNSNSSLIRLYMRQKIEEDKNTTQYLKDELVRELLVTQLTKRYNEKQEGYNIKYNILSHFSEPPLAFILNISVNEDMGKKAVKNAFRAIKEVEYFGFSVQEFNESKQDLLSQIRKGDTTSTSFWVNQIIGHFVNKEPIIPNKNVLLEDLLNKMSVQDFNVLVKRHIKGQPDDIILVADTGDPILSVSESTVRGWISEVDSLSIKPYLSPQVPKFLMDPVTTSGLKKGAYKIKKAKIPGAQEYILNNGLRVILKSFPRISELTQKNGTVYFQGVVKKGMSCFTEEDYFSAFYAPWVVFNSGVGGFDKFDVARYLMNLGFEGRVFPYVDKDDSGIKGTVKLKELETALQLVYLYITSPNANILAFEDWKQQKITDSQHVDINREDFRSTVRATLSHDGYSPIGTKALEGIEETDFERAIEIYRQLFKNPEDFTFMFTGDFPEEEVLNLCRKYLGNITSAKEISIKCKLDSPAPYVPTKPFIKSIPPPKPMKLAIVKLSYVSPSKESGLNWKEQIKTEILRRSISDLIMEHLRFKAGLIYQAGGGLTYKKSNPLLEFSIMYECLPENVEESILVSKKIREFLITEPISEPLYNEIIKSMLSNFGEVSNYRATIKEMSETYMNGEPWVNNSEKRNYIKSLTRKDLKETAQKYLGNEPFEFIMLPNKSLQ